MIGVLVLSHGHLADELVKAAKVILGPNDHLRSLSLDWSITEEEISGQIEQALADLPNAQGQILLTDLFGGTPTNIAMTFFTKGKREVITGVNLPMVVKACGLTPGMPLAELAKKLQTRGHKSIVIASEMLGEA